jgi:hypothetical protein
MSIAEVIHGHHSDGVGGEAAIGQLADMLARRASGDEISLREFERVADAVRITRRGVRAVIMKLPMLAVREPEPVELGLLSARERDVLRHLARGRAIATELGLATSAVRTDLHAFTRSSASAIGRSRSLRRGTPRRLVAAMEFVRAVRML